MADTFGDGATAFDIEFVTISEPGNPPASTAYGEVGAVPYNYRIAKHEVTYSQYAKFLNAVAASDPHQLYNSNMASSTHGGIIRSGEDGSYSYAVKSRVDGQGPGGSAYTYENKPVGFVSWTDALRFVNWLNNPQVDGDTENGAYNMQSSFNRDPKAQYWLPTEDEWFKAAAYDPVNDIFYEYQTGTNTPPNNNLPSADSGNSANFFVGNSTTGNMDYPFTDVGAYALSPSPYGTFDQLGNVTEWNESVGFSPSFRGIRGSAWFVAIHDEFNNNIALAPGDDTPEIEEAYLGFRVGAAVPEPGGWALIAANTFLMLALQWRAFR
jgi:formylglycine-generating enzyme required for sulfatase activity